MNDIFMALLCNIFDKRRFLFDENQPQKNPKPNDLGFK